MCFDSASASPASWQNDTSGCISITRSSASASAWTSRIFLPSANDCCEIPLPVIVRAISDASANVRASSAARGGVGKTLLARPRTKARAAASVGGAPEAGRVDRDVDGDHARAQRQHLGERWSGSTPGRRRSGRARRQPSLAVAVDTGDEHSGFCSRDARRGWRGRRRGVFAEAEEHEPCECDVHRLRAVERHAGDDLPSGVLDLDRPRLRCRRRPGGTEATDRAVRPAAPVDRLLERSLIGER